MGYRNNKRSANLIMQGGLMAITILIANLCVLLRQIPLTVMWGDEGNSIYSAAYGVFSFAWLFSSYALPYAVSYLLKPRLKQGQYRNASKMLKAAFLYATVIGGVLSAILFFGSSYFMKEIMQEPIAGLALQILSVAILLSAWNGVLRGFFLGNGAGFPVIISLLTEQLITLAAGIPLANVFERYGIKVGALLQNKAFECSFAVAGFSSGICIGTAVSFLFLLVLYFITHSYFKRKNGKDSGRGRESMVQVLYVFLAFLCPFIIYGIFLKGYLLAQQIMFRQFMKDGLGATVISQQWGVYFGKYKIFSSVPIMIAIAMGSTLRDKVHALYKKDDYQHIRELIQSILKVIMIVVIPLSVIIGMLAEPLLEIFFAGQDTETGATMLLTGFITSVFFSAVYLLSEILWGMKKNVVLMFCGIPALAIQIGALYIMLEVFHLDIHGVLYADIIYAFSLMMLLGVAVQKQCRIRYGFLKTNVPSALAAAVMGSILFLLSRALGDMIPSVGLVILLLILGIIIYFVLLLLLRGVSERELRLIPGGKWIISIARAVRLL